MIPASFDYDVAESVEHALELLHNGDAKLLAGGHSLIPALKLRIARPERLVDIGRLDDLAYVRDAGAQIAIGALTRHTAVASAPLLQEHCPIVSHTPRASAIRRFATAARSAARSHTATPHPTCRPSCSRSEPNWSFAERTATAPFPHPSSSRVSSRQPSARRDAHRDTSAKARATRRAGRT